MILVLTLHFFLAYLFYCLDSKWVPTTTRLCMLDPRKTTRKSYALDNDNNDLDNP
jgi:hypothetical protein